VYREILHGIAKNVKGENFGGDFFELLASSRNKHLHFSRWGAQARHAKFGARFLKVPAR